MPLRHAVAEQLRDLRARAGLSLGQVAPRAGLSRAGINDIERGKTGSTVDTLEAIVLACGGVVRLCIGTHGDAARIEAADRLAHMTDAEAAPLLRFLAVWDALPAVARDMIAQMAEVRAQFSAAGELRALPARR